MVVGFVRLREKILGSYREEFLDGSFGEKIAVRYREGFSGFEFGGEIIGKFKNIYGLGGEFEVG